MHRYKETQGWYRELEISNKKTPDEPNIDWRPTIQALTTLDNPLGYLFDTIVPFASPPILNYLLPVTSHLVFRPRAVVLKT